MFMAQAQALLYLDPTSTDDSKLRFLDYVDTRGFNMTYSGAACTNGALTINALHAADHHKEALRIYRVNGYVGFGFSGGNATTFDHELPRAAIDVSGNGYANILMQGGAQNKLVMATAEGFPSASEIIFATGHRSDGFSSYAERMSIICEPTGSENKNLGEHALEIRSNNSEGNRYGTTKLAITASGSTVVRPSSYPVNAMFQVNGREGLFVPGVGGTEYLDSCFIDGPASGLNALRVRVPDLYNNPYSMVSGNYKIRSIKATNLATGYAERAILLHKLYTGQFQHSDTGKWIYTGALGADVGNPGDTGLNWNFERGGVPASVNWTGQPNNFCIGKIHLLRGGWNGGSLVSSADVNTCSAWSNNYGYVKGQQPYTDQQTIIDDIGEPSGTWQIVTGLYDNEPWMALKLPYSSLGASNCYFEGFHHSDGNFGLSGLDIKVAPQAEGQPGYVPGQILSWQFERSYQPFNQRTDYFNNAIEENFPVLQNQYFSIDEVAAKVNFNCGDDQENIVSIDKSGIGVNLSGDQTQADLHIRGLANRQLYLDTAAAGQDAGIRFYEGPASSLNLKAHVSHDATAAGLSIFANTTPNSGIFIADADADVGIGTDAPSTKLEVNGTVTASAWAISDSRVKKNIQPISNPLDNILNLSGISFDFRNKDELDSEIISNYESKGKEVPDFFWLGKQSEVGLIAQDVEAVYPNLVHEGKYGMKAVEYAKLVPILIEAVKEQNQIISALEKRISDLEE